MEIRQSDGRHWTPERLWHLMTEHPVPPEPDLSMGLLDVPSMLRSNAGLIAFRDRTLIPLLACRPYSTYGQAVLRYVAEVLVWRSTLPPHERFWRPDPPVD